MLYVFYITTTPYLPRNNKNINRKELYDFYYTAITLTTGYTMRLSIQCIVYLQPGNKGKEHLTPTVTQNSCYLSGIHFS